MLTTAARSPIPATADAAFNALPLPGGAGDTARGIRLLVPGDTAGAVPTRPEPLAAHIRRRSDGNHRSRRTTPEHTPGRRHRLTGTRDRRRSRQALPRRGSRRVRRRRQRGGPTRGPICPARTWPAGGAERADGFTCTSCFLVQHRGPARCTPDLNRLRLTGRFVESLQFDGADGVS
jgi:hypothetical protein